MSWIGAGPNNQLWAIGKTARTAGSPDKTIYEFNGYSWMTEPGGAVRISVAPDTGVAWIVNTAGTVFSSQ